MTNIQYERSYKHTEDTEEEEEEEEIRRRWSACSQ